MKVPYHPKEFAYGDSEEPTVATGLLGVFWLATGVIASAVAAIVCVPFVVLGLAELIMDKPTQWRVRWIRRDKDTRDG